MNKFPRLLKKLIIYFLCFYLSFGGPLVSLASATAYYVDAAQSDDTGDGTTWVAAEKTIGAALTDAGSSGDVVCVKAGFYSGALSPLAGRSLYGAAASDADKDTYCGGFASFPSGTSIIYSTITYSDNGTDSTTVLDGFTVTTLGIAVNVYSTGGTVSPTITNNTITGSNLGVSIRASSIGTASPTLNNNTITGNTKNGVRIYAFTSSTASPTITNNTITGNLWSGVYISATSGGTASPALTNNTITGNTKNGVYIHVLNGGMASPTLTNNTITGNTLSGIYIWAKSALATGGTASPTISYNTISGNSNHGVKAYAQYNNNTVSPTLTNNTITGNSNDGVFISAKNGGTASPTLTNNTITGNLQNGVHLKNNNGILNADLGMAGTNTGHNTIKDNDNTTKSGTGYNTGTEYDIYNDSNSTIQAENNWWGASPPNIDTGTWALNDPNNSELIHNQDGGTLDITDADPYNAQALTFTISPTAGSESGGTVTTITADSIAPRTYFVYNVGATPDYISVTFGGISATSISVSADGTTITATTPAGSAGAADVVVTNPAGQTGTLSSTYIYDSTAPTAAITYSGTSPYKSGDVITITATFNEAMADSPVPRIAITGSNTVSATNMTKTSTTRYTYSHTVGSGNGTATVALSTGEDTSGNVITSTPTSGAAFTVDNTAPTAAITYSATSPYKSGDTVTITATFNEAMANSPVPRIAITGSNTVTATAMTKTSTTRYTYSHTVGSGNGTATVALSTGTDDAGNVITSAPASGAAFTVDNTAPSTTVSVSGGTYNSARSVTLTCADTGGSVCDKTYYTTNGDKPTTSSTEYTSAIGISISTTLKYFSTDSLGNVETVKVSEYFIVPAGTPTLSVSSTSLDFGLSTSEMNLDISNTGGGEMSWTASSNETWLSINNPSGLTQVGSNRIIVNVNRAGLSAGTYRDTITINAGSAGTAAVIVTVTVSDTPVMGYSPVSIKFGSLQTKAAILIKNLGTGTLNWTITTTLSWLSFDVNSGDTTTETDTVTMTIDRGSMTTTGANTGTIDLSDGTNTASITVTALKPDASVSFTSMTTNPSNLDADGSSTSTITATFTNCANQNDITFFTDLGLVDGASSATVSSNASGEATTTYMASSIAGIATIAAVCNGVAGAGTVNLYPVSFTNAETEIPGTGTVTMDRISTFGISLDKDGYGTPAITLAIFTSNPGSALDAITPLGAYFDAHLDETDDVDSITVKKWVTAEDISGLDTSQLGLYYTNGSEWERCSDTGYVASVSGSYVGYVFATFNSTTTPTIDFLDGLPLVASEEPVQIPTLYEWGMMLFALLLLFSGIIFIINRRTFGH